MFLYKSSNNHGQEPDLGGLASCGVLAVHKFHGCLHPCTYHGQQKLCTRLFWFLILPKMNNSVQYFLCPHQGLTNFFIFRCLRIQMTISLQNLTLASIKDFDKFVTTLNSPNLNSQRAGFSMSLKLINNEIVFSPK